MKGLLLYFTWPLAARELGKLCVPPVLCDSLPAAPPRALGLEAPAALMWVKVAFLSAAPAFPSASLSSPEPTLLRASYVLTNADVSETKTSKQLVSWGYAVICSCFYRKVQRSLAEGVRNSSGKCHSPGCTFVDRRNLL